MKRMVALMLIVSMLTAFIAFDANATCSLFNIWDYTNAENTFDIYDSTTKKAQTTNNSGITMHSLEMDGRDGYIVIHGDIQLGNYQFHDGDQLFYYIGSADIKDKCEISFTYTIDPNPNRYNDETRIHFTGTIHTYHGKKTFGSIVKIDGLKGGQYMKYTKSGS